MSSSVGIPCNTEKSEFVLNGSHNFLLGWTWKDYICPKCGATYFEIVGESAEITVIIKIEGE